MNRIFSAALIIALSSSSVGTLAQVATPAVQPATPNPPATAPVAAQPIVLPAGTQILLAVSSEINSTQNRAGDTFPLSVAQDVRVGDAIVIPRGSRAVGEITWRTGRGAFGKSGKLEFTIRYIDHNGVRVPVLGSFRQEGEGATLATIGVVVLAGVLGGFVTGSRARVPAGRELTVTLFEATPFVRTASGFAVDPAYRVPSADIVAAAEMAQRRTAAEPTCRAQATARGGRPQAIETATQRCIERTVRQRS